MLGIYSRSRLSVECITAFIKIEIISNSSCSSSLAFRIYLPALFSFSFIITLILPTSLSLSSAIASLRSTMLIIDQNLIALDSSQEKIRPYFFDLLRILSCPIGFFLHSFVSDQPGQLEC